ncbi:MAG: hypothetical protein ABW205_08375 [Burkholderiales bacterium]
MRRSPSWANICATHVKEEQREMRKAGLDLRALAARIAARNAELAGDDPKTAFLEKQADLAALG